MMAIRKLLVHVGFDSKPLRDIVMVLKWKWLELYPTLKWVLCDMSLDQYDTVALHAGRLKLVI